MLVDQCWLSALLSPLRDLPSSAVFLSSICPLVFTVFETINRVTLTQLRASLLFDLSWLIFMRNLTNEFCGLQNALQILHMYQLCTKEAISANFVNA